MPNTTIVYPSFDHRVRAPKDGWSLNLGRFENLAAHPGGGRELATPLRHGINEVARVASPGDSLILPEIPVGECLRVYIEDTKPATVYAPNREPINGADSYTLAPRKTVTYCKAGEGWHASR